jgi:putative selenium metabolism hydrolase
MPVPTPNLKGIPQRIRARVGEQREAIIQFLRDIVAIPSMDGRIGEVGERIGEEMRRLGFAEVRFDRMGNILGRLGDGPRTLLYDSHIDTVGLGDESAWEWDPFRGKIENGILFGRGACDEKGSTPGMVYGLALAQELGLAAGFTCYYFGNMEEWCEGIAPQALVEVEGIKPDFVVIGEPTDMQVYRGHRGRIELRCVTRGKSAHAAMPELGDNAIYKMTRFLASLEAHNADIRTDPFLGKGTVVASIVESTSPSLNAVPDSCTVYLDRRLTFGETKESAIAELRALPGGEDVEFHEMWYDTPSYTGYVFEVDKYFPAWAIPEGDAIVQAGVATTQELWSQRASVGRWSFSTNGIYWAGKAGIPCIGFAPSNEVYAHTLLDQVPLDDVVRSTEFYALFPALLGQELQRRA